MSPELHLAIACCAQNFVGGSGDSPMRIPSTIDWPRFLHVVRRHRIQPLAARALHRNHAAIPAAIAAELSSDAATAAERSLRQVRMCARLLGAFDDAKVPLLFVKGLTLSAIAYGDPLLKTSADVDVLVDPEDLGRAARLLDQIDSRLVIPDQATALQRWHRHCKESQWQSADGTIVELHTGLADNKAMIEGIGVRSPRQKIAVAPGIVLPTLRPEQLFAYLCVHGASSAWFRLKWLSDLVGFLLSAGRDIDGLYRLAVDQGAGRAPAQALLLAHRLFGLTISPSLRRELQSDPGNGALARLALGQLLAETEPTGRALGTATIHLSQLLLNTSWRFKASEAARQAGAIISRVISR